MAVNPPQDPVARGRARKRRAQQVRRRRIVLLVCVVGLIALIIGLSVGLSGGDETGTGGSTTTTTEAGGETTTTTSLETAASFKADLNGANSVPAVETESTGSLTLDYDPAGPSLKYSLTVNGLIGPSNAAIYEGSAGADGTAVYVLFAGPAKTGEFQGELANGTVEPDNLTGTLAGKTVGDLIALIQAGNAYVSIGNASHPVDAIRGPIQ